MRTASQGALGSPPEPGPASRPRAWALEIVGVFLFQRGHRLERILAACRGKGQGCRARGHLHLDRDFNGKVGSAATNLGITPDDFHVRGMLVWLTQIPPLMTAGRAENLDVSYQCHRSLLSGSGERWAPPRGYFAFQG